MRLNIAPDTRPKSAQRYPQLGWNHFLIYDGTNMIGDCQVEFRGTNFFLHIVIHHPDNWRRGIGTWVHDYFERNVRTHRLCPAPYLSPKAYDFWMKRNKALMLERHASDNWGGWARIEKPQPECVL